MTRGLGQESLLGANKKKDIFLKLITPEKRRRGVHKTLKKKKHAENSVKPAHRVQGDSSLGKVLSEKVSNRCEDTARRSFRALNTRRKLTSVGLKSRTPTHREPRKGSQYIGSFFR